MRMHPDFDSKGDPYGETVAMLEDQIVILEGVQTQHLELIARVYEATKRAAELEEKWPDSGRLWPLIKEIQELIEENA